MELSLLVVQLVVSLTIYNVWLLRFGKATNWRGGDAASMKEEFAVYGLPTWVMFAVGFLKLSLATFLVVGIWNPTFTKPSAMFLAVLMLAAVIMHFKVQDPPRKSLPAAFMLLLCLSIIFLA